MSYLQVSDEDIHYQTGYTKEIVDNVIEKYLRLLPSYATADDIYNILRYIHLYPTWRGAKALGISQHALRNRIFPLMEALADVLDEIHWDSRLNLYNHCPHFPTRVTGAIDTMPVYIETPGDPFLRKSFFAGKYKRSVVKVQLGIDLLGRIIVFTGPHLGTEYDGDIWRESADQHPTQPWEYLLGDGHYTASPDVFATYRKDNGGVIAVWKDALNAVISMYRIRVEHINGYFKAHSLFRQAFRGSMEVLASAIHITGHITNIILKRKPRYEPYGPWRHY